MAASLAGGGVAIVMSYFQTGGKVEVLATINGVLGALVGITASCAIGNKLKPSHPKLCIIRNSVCSDHI